MTLPAESERVSRPHRVIRLTQEEALRKLLVAFPYVWVCQECGPVVAVDEDGCCSTCGEDAYGARIEIIGGRP